LGNIWKIRCEHICSHNWDQMCWSNVISLVEVKLQKQLIPKRRGHEPDVCIVSINNNIIEMLKKRHTTSQNWNALTFWLRIKFWSTTWTGCATNQSINQSTLVEAILRYHIHVKKSVTNEGLQNQCGDKDNPEERSLKNWVLKIHQHQPKTHDDHNNVAKDNSMKCIAPPSIQPFKHTSTYPQCVSVHLP
jgi:hypothetical protein